MAIRKPNLSVKEARQLASARNMALDSDLPLLPLDPDPSAASVAENKGGRSQATDPLVTREREPATQIFLSAPFPADGVSYSFDFLSRQYPPDKALRMVLRRALDNYEVLLEDGELHSYPLDYPIQKAEPKSGTIQTSRMMRVALLRRARAFFDPLGFESERAFGRKLATAALAAFFKLEKRRP